MLAMQRRASRDEPHLSPAGANYLAEQLRDTLFALLSKTPEKRMESLSGQ